MIPFNQQVHQVLLGRTPCASPAGFPTRMHLRYEPDISLANKSGQLDMLPTEFCIGDRQKLA
jgi:hypothetical protein